MTAPETHIPVTADELAHTFEEAPPDVDLSGYSVEDWIGIAVFWVMTAAVFLQFFTRYVLNNSFAWTEEIAIYCLVALVFIGAVGCIRLGRHIQVDILYRFVGGPTGRVLSTIVDLVRIGFFAYASWLVWKYVSIVGDERMTTVDLPKGIVFYTVFAAFLAMLVRSVVVALQHLRRGYSDLERPESYEAEA